jgi:TPR repeat protein
VEQKQSIDQDIFQSKRWLVVALHNERNAGNVVLIVNNDIKQQDPKCVMDYLRADGSMMTQITPWTSAEEGGAQLLHTIALFNERGDTTAKNEASACQLYRLASAMGFAPRKVKLGQCFEAGRGVPVDKPEALRYYRSAAMQGDADAMAAVGYCLLKGIGADQNHQEAVSLFQRAAVTGNLRAMHSLGWCYMDGLGIAKDHREALKLFTRASDLGYASAQHSLG